MLHLTIDLAGLAEDAGSVDDAPDTGRIKGLKAAHAWLGVAEAGCVLSLGALNHPACRQNPHHVHLAMPKELALTRSLSLIKPTYVRREAPPPPNAARRCC